MGRYSKVLNSHLKSEIDELLLQGNSPNYIEKWCKDKGVIISHTSIRRYANEHLPEWNQVKENLKNPNSEAVKEMTPNPFVIPISEIKDTKELNKIIARGLKNAMVGMISIVEVKIGEYAAGNTKLPREEVAVLEKLTNIFDRITGKKSHTRAGKNIFDVDDALKDSEVKQISDNTVEDLLKSLKI